MICKMRKTVILFIGLLAASAAFGQSGEANLRAIQENLDRVDMLIVNTQSKIAEARAKLERRRNDIPDNQYNQRLNQIERFEERLDDLKNDRQDLMNDYNRRLGEDDDDDRIRERKEIQREIRQANEELQIEMAEIDRELEQAHAEGNEEKINELHQKRAEKINKYEEKVLDIREKGVRKNDYDDDRRGEAGERRKERQELDRELAEIDREIAQARAEGKPEKVAELQAKREEKINKFHEKMREKNQKDRRPEKNKMKERGYEKNKEDRGKGNPNP